MITLNKVNKIFNKNKSSRVHALKDITLELPEKGMVAIFGKSGCGKTTLLNAIGGLDSLSSGEILFDSESISKKEDIIRNRDIGYIFQNYCLDKSQTVYENVASALLLCGISDKEVINRRVMAALSKVGMEKFIRRTPDALSGGQQQRVAIARAIVKSPSVILADEPTGNIDEKNTIAVMELLRAISKDSLVLLVTHEAHLVDYYCDRVIEISDGSVISARDNEEKLSYNGKDKNAVYLKDLPKSEQKLDGIDIAYYGDSLEGVSIKIVKSFGKLYISCEGAEIRSLDTSNEIKLIDAHEEEIVKEEDCSVEYTALERISGNKFGRLFTFKKAAALSAQEYFVFGKKKKNILLCLCLFMLSGILVAGSANFGVGIKKYLDVSKNHDDSVFYIPVVSTLNSTELMKEGFESGSIDYAGLTNKVGVGNESNIYFTYEGFTTAENFSLYSSGVVASTKLMKESELICGKNTLEKPFEMIITTAVADAMLKNCPVGFITQYSDLLGLSYQTNNHGGEIVGIVSGNEKYFYLDELSAANYALTDASYIYPNVLPSSLCSSVYDKEIPSGSAVLFKLSGSPYDSTNVMIGGQSFKLSEKTDMYYDPYSYPEYVKAKNDILSFEDYYSKLKVSSPETGVLEAESRYVFEHYFSYMPGFVKSCGDYSYIPLEWWVYMNYESPKYLYYSLELTGMYGSLPFATAFNDLRVLYGAKLYYSEKGVYPDSTEFMDEYESQIPDTGRMWTEIYSFEGSYFAYTSGKENILNYDYNFIINDSDYIALTYNIGHSSPEIYANLFSYSDEYPFHYLMLHSSSPEKTAAYLESNGSGIKFISPEEAFDMMLSESYTEILSNIFSLLFMLVLICIFVYFMMRSVTMSKIKQIGIYRAIGVSRKNIVFKFFTDANFLIITTVTVGYLLAAFGISKLTASSLFSEMFYFPLWLAITVFALLYAICIFFSLLPISSLMRKTPAQILAKYDI